MNTKTFAQQSRALLMEGVANKLLFWGFKPDGTTSEEPNSVAGGYTFRGKVFDDETVPKLWKSLHQAINKKGIDVVKEEAAYTWFNRIMALQIMAKNDYLEVQLAYVSGMANTPQILQKARQGQFSFLNNKEQERLKRIITDFSKEQEAFALLLVGYCHSNKMLNNVFGKLDDYTELLLPDNMLQDSGFLHLLNTTDAISDEQYKEVELIGWLYQFYISERKDEVFASFKKKKKAEAKDIPAATQIFTPNWIVKYMVQNTVGKIWLDKNPNSKIKSSLKYLVENDTSTELSASSDSTSEPIISDVSQLTLIDPAAGSGHILVEGFDLLYQMYMEEYYTPEEAVESILKNNLFGLDLDDRAAQLATFAILLKAAKQYRDVFVKGWLPNVYTMPEYATFSVQEIKDYLGTDGTAYEKELAVALSLMEQAKNLGSLMRLNISNDARLFMERRYSELKSTDYRDINTEIVYQKIKTFIPVLLILSNKYTSVVANPPYMGSGNMNGFLKDYININFPDSKSDLCTVFIEVLPSYSKSKFAFIVPPSWMFLSTFEEMRKKIISNYSIDSSMLLSRGVFGADFGSTCTVMDVSKRPNSKGIYFRLLERTFQEINQEHLRVLFLESNRDIDFKFYFKGYNSSNFLISHSKNGQRIYFPDVSQDEFERIPKYRFGFWASENYLKMFDDSDEISDYAYSDGKNVTGDNLKFLRYLWEPSMKYIGKEKKWMLMTKGGDYRRYYGNTINLMDWSLTARNHYRSSNSGRLIPEYLWFKRGITWSKIASKGASFRYLREDSTFDEVNIYFKDESILECVLAFLNSKIPEELFKIFNPTFSLQTENILEIPLSRKIIEIKDNPIFLDQINLCKKDWDSREISFDFEKSPMVNDNRTLKEAYHEWQSDFTKDFYNLHKNEEELNSIFIDIYGLKDELSPDVALKDISILQEELKKNDLDFIDIEFRANDKKSIELPIKKGEVINQFISYAIGLFMGRYRLNKPGLNIAHPNPTKEELSSYTYNNGEVIIDQDAILPIMGKNCNFNDDVVKQFAQLLDTIWGHEQRTENINFIQECLDKELEKFLINDFWSYHCGMYKKTPIYWLFSSKKGAFQVLVYMHRMNEFTVEKIRANYLLEHLKYLKSEIAQKEANASSLSTAEARQLDKLRADLIECEQYDMALKNIADQQIKFDLDDGVAKNYELFEKVVAKIK
jgi:hypothetical protein